MSSDTEEHPDDGDAYGVFAELMGWAVPWGKLGTWKDVPGPGKVPFMAAFRPKGKRRR